MQQRYYDPMIGRFLSVDPVSADTVTGWNFNRYNYAANNPYKFTDPDGRSIWTKLIKFVVKGGDIAQTTAGLVDDYNVASDSSVSFPRRLIASTSMASEILPVSGGDLKDAAKAISKIGGKGDVAGDAAKLNKKLGSEQQLGEVMSGKGEVIAGGASGKELRDAPRLSATHGGNESDWTKVSSSSHTAPDGQQFSTHAYQNQATGQVVEPKTKIVEEN